MPIPAIIPAILPLVAQFAPGLIKQFAGDKAGAVAESVASVAATVAGVSIDPAKPETVQEAVQKIQQDPAKQLEFATKTAEIEMELEKAYLADIQDARARDVRLAGFGKESMRPNIMLALAFLSIIAIAALICLVPDVPQQVVGFLTAIGGMFARNIGSAFDFEFGSSRGSKEKDAAMAKMAEWRK